MIPLWRILCHLCCIWWLLIIWLGLCVLCSSREAPRITLQLLRSSVGIPLTLYDDTCEVNKRVPLIGEQVSREGKKVSYVPMPFPKHFSLTLTLMENIMRVRKYRMANPRVLPWLLFVIPGHSLFFSHFSPPGQLWLCKAFLWEHWNRLNSLTGYRKKWMMLTAEQRN